MSHTPGRNAPCSCGSGKKYKRCCLGTDEAAAREHDRQQALFDDEWLDLEASDEDEFIDEDYGPRLDAGDIVRVCYTRGWVRQLSHLRSGRDVQVTEWNAPHIPPAVLASIEREAVDELEGEWGHPKAGDPIQVDIIDLESSTDVVTIQVFNRAICLIDADSEETRRLHRVCGALESAAGTDPPADAPAGSDGSCGHRAHRDARGLNRDQRLRAAESAPASGGNVCPMWGAPDATRRAEAPRRVCSR